jgi:hypothetical protein
MLPSVLRYVGRIAAVMHSDFERQARVHYWIFQMVDDPRSLEDSRSLQ